MVGVHALKLFCDEVEKYNQPARRRLLAGFYTGFGACRSAKWSAPRRTDGAPRNNCRRRPVADGRTRRTRADGGAEIGEQARQPAASNGSLLNLKMMPSTLEGEHGLNSLADFRSPSCV